MGDQLNRLFPTAAAAAVLVLTGCGGGGATVGSTASVSSAPDTTKVFTADQTCHQLFANGDEGRLFGPVTFLTNLPDPVTTTDQTKAKIFATDLEFVGKTANDEFKPLIAEMAKSLNELATAQGSKVEFDADPFKTAGSKIIDMCPTQAEAYGDEKIKKEAAAKAAEEAAAKKAADEAAAKAAAEAAAAPKEYAGAGADVVTITKHGTGPQVAIITHAGYSNFAVHTLDASLGNTDLLVNTIGNYSGTVLFDVRTSRGETTALKITGDGSWTVKLVPLASVRSFDGATPMTGRGDDVFYYKGAAKPAIFTHDGTSNIAVHSYGTRADLLINEIGAYTGTVVWTPGLYEVTADGNWSATLK